MSRLGITFDDVAKAADELIKSGESPTIDKIRFALGGTGSFTTISKYLNTWRHGVIPNHVNNKVIAPDFVQSAVERAWQEIHEQADAEIERIKEEADKQIEAALNKARNAEERYTDIQLEHNELTQVFQRLSAEKELLSLDFKSLSQEFTLLQDRYKSLDERYTDMQQLTSQHLKDMSQSHKNEITRLEQMNMHQENHYKSLLDGIKCQSEHDRHQHIALVDSLKTEIQKKDKNVIELQNTVNNKNLELAKLEAENAVIKSERDFALTRIDIQDNTWRDFTAKSFISDDLMIKINKLPKMDLYIEQFYTNLLTTLDDKLFEFKNSLMPFSLVDSKENKDG